MSGNIHTVSSSPSPLPLPVPVPLISNFGSYLPTFLLIERQNSQIIASIVQHSTSAHTTNRIASISRPLLLHPPRRLPAQHPHQNHTHTGAQQTLLARNPACRPLIHLPRPSILLPFLPLLGPGAHAAARPRTHRSLRPLRLVRRGREAAGPAPQGSVQAHRVRGVVQGGAG